VPVVQADAWFETDRVRPVTYTSYAVTNPEGSFALPQAKLRLI